MQHIRLRQIAWEIDRIAHERETDDHWANNGERGHAAKSEASGLQDRNDHVGRSRRQSVVRFRALTPDK